MALLAAATPAIMEQAGPHVLVGGSMATQTLSYGADPKQTVTLFTREKAARPPLIVYLHGGGWSAGTPKAGYGGRQAEHWTSRGYAYAATGYRFVPAATVEQQLSDAAKAIALLRKQKGLDPDRIVLLGHSSGGHLAAMLGADPAWLEKAGVPFGAVKAVVLLDPAGLDIPPIMAIRGDGTIERYYRPAFGDDPARQSTLSPMKQTEPPNAPAWLMLHDANNPYAGAQSADLAAALKGAGAREATVQAIAGTTHLRLNDEIGQPGNEATGLIEAFLARALPENQRRRVR
ncbi:MAG TPA: alpha/beta hydrolase [Sphingomonas sp.]|nr:alpha/beta hydrolase [Sphingomonas sp.]